MRRVSAEWLLSTVALLAGCHSGNEAQPVAIERVQAHVVTSQQQEIPAAVRATGTVHARESAMVAAQVMGRVERVLVQAGDSVRAGQTLAILNDAALRSSVDEARAGVAAAQQEQIAAQSQASLTESTLARYQELQAQKSVSPQEMDEVMRRAEAAEAQLKAARAQTEAAQAQERGAQTMLSYTRLTAPFNGVVTARMADPGTMAAPGVPLLQVDQAGALRLEATVDESLIGSVRLGMAVPVSVDGVGMMKGVVAEIVPAADLQSHSFTVKIDLPASHQVHAGMYGSAEFANGTRQAILVPRSAVMQNGSLNSAYVLNSNGIAELRAVTLGAPQGDLVEVLSGIAPGEKLVDAPADRDLAGKQIEAQP